MTGRMEGGQRNRTLFTSHFLSLFLAVPHKSPRELVITRSLYAQIQTLYVTKTKSISTKLPYW